MTNEQKQDPIDVGTSPAFPPTEAPRVSGIADSTPTTASGGPIGDATSAATTLKPAC